MSDYIDFVICNSEGREGRHLYQAPKYSGLKKGDMVLVETYKSKSIATVEQKTMVEKGSDLYNFLIEVTHSVLPLRKVLGKYTFTGFEYEDDAGIIEQG